MKETVKNNTDQNLSIDHSAFVKSEIDTIKAFWSAQNMLVSQYGNLIDKLYEYAPVIITIADITNHDNPHVYINKFVEKELGYQVHDFLTNGFGFFESKFHPDELKDTLKKNARFINNLCFLPQEEADKLVLEQVKRIQHIEGYYLWFNVRTTLLSRKNDGSPHLILTIMSNVNDSVELQHQKQITLNLEISLLQERIKAQNEQLQTHLLASVENSKYFDEVNRYIKSISKDLPDEFQEYFNLIVNFINRNKPSDNVWEEFIERFQGINPNFINILAKEFPGLTPTELKICSLTKTGLNSKDISHILKISSRSVETHKYNIRKKLNLEPYQNLYNHINLMS